jgi:hypothetical protein
VRPVCFYRLARSLEKNQNWADSCQASFETQFKEHKVTEKWKASSPRFSYNLDGKLYTFRCNGNLKISKKHRKSFKNRGFDDYIENKRSRKALRKTLK